MNIHMVASALRLLACVVIWRQQDFIVPLQWWLNTVAVCFALPELLTIIHGLHAWRKT